MPNISPPPLYDDIVDQKNKIKAGEIWLKWFNLFRNEFNSYRTALSGPATTAETKTGTATDKSVTPAGLLTAVGFSAYFESAEQTITSAGALTIAHGLGREPIIYAMVLKCIAAEQGYSVGNKLVPAWSNTEATTNHRWISLVVDSTNLNIRFGSAAAVFVAAHKTTGDTVALTNASWRAIFRALG